MWVDLGSGFIEAVCKSSGHKTVEQKPAWRSSVFIAVTLTFLDVSRLKPVLVAGINLEEGRQKEAGLPVISSNVVFNN